MKRRRLIKIFALIVLMTQLSACFFASGEQLYKLPQMPKDYESLQIEIDKVLDSGAEYAAPTAGFNRSAVQKVDIDGDGSFECVAFFKTSEDLPLKIYVFKLEGDVYQLMAKAEAEGEYFDNVVYSDLANTGSRQIIAACKVGALCAVNVYAVSEEGAAELLSTNCAGFSVYDIDADEDRELLVVRGSTPEAVGHVEVYRYEGGSMVHSSTAPLSEGTESITRIKTGFLIGEIPALFVAGTFGKGSEDSVLVTDILAVRDGSLENITLNKGTNISEETMRQYGVYAANMSDDNILGLPQSVRLPAYDDNLQEGFWQINWRAYSIDGTSKHIMSTYHNFSDGWYLILPKAWEGNITVWRRDIIQGERSIIFAKWNGSTGRPEPFLAIYTLTGENREERAALRNIFVLKSSAYTIYAAEFLTSDLSAEFLTDENTIKENFKYIQSEWIGGEMYG